MKILVSLSRTLRLPVVAGLLLLTLFAVPATAQKNKKPAKQPVAEATLTDTIDSLIIQQMATDSVAGATLLIAQNGKLIKTRGYGIANLENGVLAGPETRYELASISKPITGTAILQLVEQGKLALDSSVAAYIPGAPEAYKQITIRNLLTHTGGLASDHYVHTKLYAPVLLRYTAKEQLNDLFKLKTAAPNEKFVYSNAAFFLLAAIIEQVTGQTYKSYMQQNILDKAGMRETSFLNGDSIVPFRAQGYTRRKGQWVRFSLEWVMQSLDANGFSGFIAPAADLDKFCTALADGKLISAATFNAAMQPSKFKTGAPVMTVGNRAQMGLGWFLKTIAGRNCIFHNGHTGTVVLYFPAERLTIVLLTNLGGGYGGLAGDRGFRVAELGFSVAEAALNAYVQRTQ